jgi:peroxiredoxin
MATPEPPKLGVKAPDFSLPATDGVRYSLSDIMGENGAVIVFICNHCPYVKAITARLVSDAEMLAKQGIGFAAICSNDAISYPDDSFESMVIFAKESGFIFPYLHDESQEVAKAWGAVCTPDFFGLNNKGMVQYRGRLDEGRTSPPHANVRRDLLEAMQEIAKTSTCTTQQNPSVGCSIKWK